MSRVLYVSADPGVPVLGHKGASVHVRALAAAFDALGHEVKVASPRVEAAENELPETIELVELPAVVPKDAPDERTLAVRARELEDACVGLAREWQPDLVYERYALATAAGAAVRAATGAPLVVEVNAPLRAEAERFRTLRHEPVARDAERRLFAAADAIFAVSAGVAEWLGGDGVDTAKIRVVPNAYPQWSFVPRGPIGPDDDVIVGFAGGMKLWHGVDVLATAFSAALEAGARLRLVLAGKGPADELLDAADLPPDRVTRLGHLPHAAALRLLESWHVGVAPFKPLESFWFSPLKLYEYMAAGLCPVVSDVGDLPAIVDHGRAGVVVPAGDSDALAGALIALDADRERLLALAHAAQDRASRGPTWVETARQALAVAAVEEGPRR